MVNMRGCMSEGITDNYPDEVISSREANPNSGYLRLAIAAVNIYLAYSGNEILEKIAISSILIKDVLLSNWRNNPNATVGIHTHHNKNHGGTEEKSQNYLKKISPIRLIGKVVSIGATSALGYFSNKISIFSHIQSIAGAVRAASTTSILIQSAESIINYHQERPRTWGPKIFECPKNGARLPILGDTVVFTTPVTSDYGTNELSSTSNHHDTAIINTLRLSKESKNND